MEDTESKGKTCKKEDLNLSKTKEDMTEERVTDTDRSPSFFQTVENYYNIMMEKVVKRYKWLGEK